MAAPVSPRPGPRWGRAPGGERDRRLAQAARRDQPDPGPCCPWAGGSVVLRGPSQVLAEPGRVWLHLPVFKGAEWPHNAPGAGRGQEELNF